jgi:hypothetical protein
LTSAWATRSAPPEEVWQLTDEMLAAEAQWLPQYADEIPRARARLETAGAARLPVKLRMSESAKIRLFAHSLIRSFASIS